MEIFIGINPRKVKYVIINVVVANTKNANLREQIIKVGKILDEKSMLPATSGNLSLRENYKSSITITRSGKSKGDLNIDDFLEIDLNGNPLSNDLKKPSAETLLHTQLYKFSDSINAVFHVHSINSVVISKIIKANNILELKDYELLKALAGINTHRHTEIVPVFANTQNIKLLAADVDQFMRIKPEIHGYLIEGHGLYTWGSSADEALRHIEAFETLFAMELELMKHDLA